MRVEACQDENTLYFARSEAAWSLVTANARKNKQDRNMLCVCVYGLWKAFPCDRSH